MIRQLRIQSLVSQHFSRKLPVTYLPSRAARPPQKAAFSSFVSPTSMAPFNVYTATAGELHDLLENKKLSSVDIVQQYLKHIHEHEARLHALVEVASEDKLLSFAKQLDDERAQGSVRGPLHGIPIIVKDNIATHPDLGLLTTGGSFAFTDLKPKETAACTQRLVDAGCIIVGKSNLSEFANFKAAGMPCGWSARGGQSQSPYVKGGWDPSERFGGHSGPGGSSSGSAISVAAGYAPISIGTETWGSLIMPATRANVFTLKGSRGAIPMSGVMPVNDIYDIAGPMAKSALDIAIAFEAMSDRNNPNRPQSGWAASATGSWDGLRLGAVETANWKLDEILAVPDNDWFQTQDHDIKAAYLKLKEGGVSIKHPVPFAERGDLGDVLRDVINYNFVRCFESFLSSMESSSVKTVKELVEFNKSHAEVEMPPEADNQDLLIGALDAEPWTEERTQARVAEGAKYAGSESIDRCLDDNDINIILGPADCWLTDFACVSGYPSAMLPLSFWKGNGRAFGVIAITRNHREDLLIQLMSAWEKVFPHTALSKL